MNAKERQTFRDLVLRLRLVTRQKEQLEREVAYRERRAEEVATKRLWAEARDASVTVETLIAQLQRISAGRVAPKHFNRCEWCGELCLGPACRLHFDLMSPADLLEEALSA